MSQARITRIGIGRKPANFFKVCVRARALGCGNHEGRSVRNAGRLAGSRRGSGRVGWKFLDFLTHARPVHTHKAW